MGCAFSAYPSSAIIRASLGTQANLSRGAARRSRPMLCLVAKPPLASSQPPGVNRPMLYLVYAKPWFTDVHNFPSDAPLFADPDAAVGGQHAASNEGGGGAGGGAGQQHGEPLQPSPPPSPPPPRPLATPTATPPRQGNSRRPWAPPRPPRSASAAPVRRSPPPPSPALPPPPALSKSRPRPRPPPRGRSSQPRRHPGAAGSGRLPRPRHAPARRPPRRQAWLLAPAVALPPTAERRDCLRRSKRRRVESLCRRRSRW